MKQLKKLLKILNVSCDKNGEDKILTVGHLRNIVNLAMQKRDKEKFFPFNQKPVKYVIKEKITLLDIQTFKLILKVANEPEPRWVEYKIKQIMDNDGGPIYRLKAID